ncbi:Telomere repeat-binding factor like [Melia azedarach]|uniref:Telomere repeat-binding factor like n=1 Tax=Melia azedarach TaxID=155640 RepID=A0ACC1Y5R6_MELAZ|nr:Telomere repeat-binding factor like [Melia azedarach]
MGNQKQKWTAEEEEALLAGVGKHGPGKWKNILKDPEFAPSLVHRSNIDLKDKWRNLSVSTAQQGSKDKSRVPKIKATITTTLSNNPNSAPAAPLARSVSSGAVVNDPASSALDGKNGPKYNSMIFEAISTIKDTNGSDISAIVNFIEERHEVPPNFRRLLSSRLRRLVSQGKLEKVQNCYKIRKDISLGVKTPTPKQKDARLRLPQNSALVTPSETVEEASITAAYRIAEAENKSFLAAEAVKEAERVSKMAEDTDAMLQLVKEIYEQCSRGEIVLLA